MAQTVSSFEKRGTFTVRVVMGQAMPTSTFEDKCRCVGCRAKKRFEVKSWEHVDDMVLSA